MTEITRRRVGELQQGIFKILLEHSDGLPAKEILDRLEGLVPPTDFERSEYPKRPGVRRLLHARGRRREPVPDWAVAFGRRAFESGRKSAHWILIQG